MCKPSEPQASWSTREGGKWVSLEGRAWSGRKDAIERVSRSDQYCHGMILLTTHGMTASITRQAAWLLVFVGTSSVHAVDCTIQVTLPPATHRSIPHLAPSFTPSLRSAVALTFWNWPGLVDSASALASLLKGRLTVPGIGETAASSGSRVSIMSTFWHQPSTTP